MSDLPSEVVTGCRHASEFTATTNGKPLRYALTPDTEMLPGRSFASLVRSFARRESA